MLPLLVLVVPILDTTLVTVRRTIERRPVTQGGTDHSLHRLVYYGLSEQQAVVALTLLALLLGATALAYNVLANARVTAVGSVLSRSSSSSSSPASSATCRNAPATRIPARLRRSGRAFFSNPRRLVEVLTDFGIICFSFLASYLLFVDGGGSYIQRGIFLAVLPILLGVRYVLFVVFGIYRRIWRFASARDLLAIAGAVVLSVPLTIGIVRAIPSLYRLPARDLLRRRVAVHDAGRGVTAGAALCSPVSAVRASPQQRVLIVGAGRSGRALARELAETPRRASSGSSTTTRH